MNGYADSFYLRFLCRIEGIALLYVHIYFVLYCRHGILNSFSNNSYVSEPIIAYTDSSILMQYKVYFADEYKVNTSFAYEY